MSHKPSQSNQEPDTKAVLVPRLRFPEFAAQPWRAVCLGDVTAESTTRNAGRSRSMEVMGVTKAEGIVPMEERVIAADRSRYKVVSKNWFAYNPMRLNIGSIARWHGDQDILVSPDYVVFRCIEDHAHGITPQFLDHFRTADCWRDFVTESGLGSVRVRIYYKDIAQIELNLPKTAEQQKIADCLSSLDELIAAQARKVDALKTHKNGLMQQLFPRGCETQPHLRFPEFQNTGKWKERKLGTVCDIQRGRFSHRPRNDSKFFGGQHPFIQTGDVVKSGGGEIIASQSLNEEGLAVSKLFKPTIVLITIAANIGDTGLLQKEGCFTDSVAGLIPNKDVTPVFLELIMRGQKEYLNKVATTGAQKNINNEILREVSVLVPSVPEQQRIADCHTSLDTLITAATQELDTLKTHKKGLMQQLFPAAEEVVA